MTNILFQSWENVARLFITMLFAYPGVIILLRVSGKRSLSKLNMFDFIITIALGSVFASVIILKDITITDGLVTFSVLLGFQFLISWSSLRFDFLEDIIKSAPTLLYYESKFLEEDMKAARVTKHEIYSSVRQSGIACMNDVYAVVLENNGDLSVIKAKDNIANPTLIGINNHTVTQQPNQPS